MYNLIVFASGNGSTLQTIIDNINSGNLDAKINLVVSNKPDCFALERAANAGISTYVITKSDFDDADAELEGVLSNYDVDLIVLAGYLKKIGPKLIEKYRIINTHPSLLPKYGGKGMHGMHVHQAVVDAHEKVSGATIHFVNNEYDKGSIISQTEIEVLPTDTASDVSTKVQAAEKIQLINVLKDFINKKL